MPIPLAMVLLLLSIGIAAAAEPFCGEDAPHPIDVWFDTTIESQTTTADISSGCNPKPISAGTRCSINCIKQYG